MASQGTRSYVDFEPDVDWLRGEEEYDTILIKLPEFTKENIKVQIDNYGNLRTSGERPLGGDRWQRFWKDFRLPENCDVNAIRAKFEKDTLHVRLPKGKKSTPITPEKSSDLTQSPMPRRRRESIPPSSATAAPKAPSLEQKPSVTKQESKVADDDAKRYQDKNEKKTLKTLMSESEKENEKEKEREREKEKEKEKEREKEKEKRKEKEKEKEREEVSKLGGGGGGEEKIGERKQWLDGVVKEMRKPRQMLLMNVMVAVMVLLGMVMYATYKLRTRVTGEEDSG